MVGDQSFEHGEFSDHSEEGIDARIRLGPASPAASKVYLVELDRVEAEENDCGDTHGERRESKKGYWKKQPPDPDSTAIVNEVAVIRFAMKRGHMPVSVAGPEGPSPPLGEVLHIGIVQGHWSVDHQYLPSLTPNTDAELIILRGNYFFAKSANLSKDLGTDHEPATGCEDDSGSLLPLEIA